MGKLALHRPLPQIISDQQESNQLQLLPVQAAHVFNLQVLPVHHKDPFDRMLIAQAITDDLVVLSADAMFGRYPVRVIAA